MLSAFFDRVILYEDHYLRGRPDGEIIRLIREGVQHGTRTQQIDEVRGADAAVELALRSAASGDLMLVQADTVDETLQFIRQYLESIAEPAIAAELTAVAEEAAKKGPEETPRKPASPETIASGAIAASPSVAKV